MRPPTKCITMANTITCNNVRNCAWLCLKLCHNKYAAPINSSRPFGNGGDTVYKLVIKFCHSFTKPLAATSDLANTESGKWPKPKLNKNAEKVSNSKTIAAPLITLCQ